MCSSDLTGAGAYPTSPPSTHHPIVSLGRSQHQQKQLHGRIIYEDEDNMILIETGKDLMDRAVVSEGATGPIPDDSSTSAGNVERDRPFSGGEKAQHRNSLLESMRAEIRLENERMEDATKSLLMDDDDATFRIASSDRTNGAGENHKTTNSAARSSSFPRPPATDRKYSAPEIGHGLIQHSNQLHILNSRRDREGRVMEEDAVKAGGYEGSLYDHIRTRQASLQEWYSSSVEKNAAAGPEMSTNTGITRALALLSNPCKIGRASCRERV